MRIKISIDGLKPFLAEIIDAESKTLKGLKSSLPMESSVNRWGDEIYFFVNFEAPIEKGARSQMKVGEIAYWPNGPALAIFFGPTPASKGSDPVAASDCNIVGRTDALPIDLRKARDGARIILSKEP